MKISLIGLSHKLTPEDAKYIFSVEEKKIDSFEELVGIVTAYHWAPGQFIAGETKSGKASHYKAEQFFKSTDLIGIDIDSDLTLEEGIKVFGGFKCVIGTTKSHQKQKGEKPPCDRYRVIIKLRVPITKSNIDDYAATYSYLNKMADGKLDDSCKNPSRYFNACEKIVHINSNGVELQPVEATKIERNTQSPVIITSSTRGHISYKTKEFLEKGAKEGERNVRLYLAAKDLQQQLYPPNEIYALLEKSIGKYDDAYTRSTIDSALKDSPKHPPRLQPFPYMVKIGKESGLWKPDKTHPDNIKHFLYNIFGIDKIFFQKYFGTGIYIDDESITDNLLSRIRVEGRIQELGMSIDLYDTVIQSEALKNERNPVKDYIDSKPWDGKDRFDDLYTSLTCIADNETDRDYYKKILKKWFVSTIAQAVTEGGSLIGKNIVNQIVPILKNGQGSGKSRWISSIIPDYKWFVDGPVNPTNKDHEARLMNTLIWHVSEFENVTSKKEVGELKSFFTKGFIEIRLPYARKPISGYQVCSFIASVNEDIFLKDLTGNRRYPVFEVVAPNAEHGIDLQQLYAQAYHMFLNNFVYYTTTEENQEITRRADKYMLESTTDMWISLLEGKEDIKPISFQDLYLQYVSWCKDNNLIAENTSIVSRKLLKSFKGYHTKPQNKSYYRVVSSLDVNGMNSVVGMTNNFLNKFD